MKSEASHVPQARLGGVPVGIENLASVLCRVADRKSARYTPRFQRSEATIEIQVRFRRKPPAPVRSDKRTRGTTRSTAHCHA